MDARRHFLVLAEPGDPHLFKEEAFRTQTSESFHSPSMDNRAGNTDTDMPERIAANDFQRWYAMFLSVILSYLQLSQQQRQGGGGGDEEARIYSQAAALCFSMALITLTTSSPLPCSSKALQIGLFHLILGCAFPLSWAVPIILWWTPFLSCIRPFFHLLPDRFRLHILQFSRSVWNDSKLLVSIASSYVVSIFPFPLTIMHFFQSQWNDTGRLVAAGASQNVEPSSPIQANFNSQQVIELRDQEVSSTYASMSLASSSSQA